MSLPPPSPRMPSLAFVRRFLLPVVAALSVVGCAPAEPTALPTLEGSPPSVILHGGSVITMELDMPRAEAIAVRGDEIVAVGSSEQLLGAGWTLHAGR